MTRKPWNPIHPDGTLNDADLSAPVTASESTTWILSEDPVGLVAAGSLLALMVDPRFSKMFARHRFIVPLRNVVVTLHWGMFPNVTIVSPVIRTQEEANEILNEMLGVRAVRKEVVFTPTEEIGVSGLALGIATVRVRGGDRPMHPDHVRILRDQAKTAGVGFSLSWGDWAPAAGRTDTDTHTFSDGVQMHCVGSAHSGCTLDGVEYPDE